MIRIVHGGLVKGRKTGTPYFPSGLGTRRLFALSQHTPSFLCRYRLGRKRHIHSLLGFLCWTLPGRNNGGLLKDLAIYRQQPFRFYLREQKGVCASVLHVVIVIFLDPHNVATHEPEPLPFCLICIHISPHLIRALVLDLEIPHGNLISDKKKTVLEKLAVFPALILPLFARIMVELLS